MRDGAAQDDEDLKSRIAVLEAELASVRRAHDQQAQMREQAEHEREQYRKLYSLVLFELERLKRQLFGKKAESVDPNQVQLAFGPVLDALARVEAGEAGAQTDVQAELAKLRAAAEQAGEESKSRNKGKRGKGHGRRDFDAERAPVEVIVLEPPERSLPGGESLVKIGEEVSEHSTTGRRALFGCVSCDPSTASLRRLQAARRSSSPSCQSDRFHARSQALVSSHT
jgi:hypothetical protein